MKDPLTFSLIVGFPGGAKNGQVGVMLGLSWHLKGIFARPLARGVLDIGLRFLLIDSPPLNPLPRGLRGPADGGGKIGVAPLKSDFH